MLSRIKISNFPGFSELDVALSGAVVDENPANALLYALRSIFDRSRWAHLNTSAGLRPKLDDAAGDVIEILKKYTQRRIFPAAGIETADDRRI